MPSNLTRQFAMGLAAGIMLAGIAACDKNEKVTVRQERYVYDHHRGAYVLEEDYYDKMVVVEPGHVCSHGCNLHYHDGSRIRVIRRHTHGPNCGHVWNGRYWVSAGPVYNTHVCSQGCNYHYYDGNRVIYLDGHRHGPSCGHTWNGRYWVSRPGGTVVRERVIRSR